MPVVFVLVPAAVALAWLALKGGRPGGLRNVIPGGGLEGGATQDLEGGRRREPEPWRRDELPFASGGELGGPYGPGTQEQAPSAPEGGFTEGPAATQTELTWYGGQSPTLAELTSPQQWGGTPNPDPGPTSYTPPAYDPGPTQAIAPAYVAPQTPAGGGGSSSVRAQ